MRTWPALDSLVCQALFKVVHIQHEGDRQEALDLVRKRRQTTKDTGCEAPAKDQSRVGLSGWWQLWIGGREGQVTFKQRPECQQRSIL